MNDWRLLRKQPRRLVVILLGQSTFGNEEFPPNSPCSAPSLGPLESMVCQIIIGIEGLIAKPFARVLQARVDSIITLGYMQRSLCVHNSLASASLAARFPLSGLSRARTSSIRFTGMLGKLGPNRGDLHRKI